MNDSEKARGTPIKKIKPYWFSAKQFKILAPSAFGSFPITDCPLTEAETEMKTEISEDDFANAKRVNEGGIWRPRRDLNPCYRRERLASRFQANPRTNGGILRKPPFLFVFRSCRPCARRRESVLIIRVNCPENCDANRHAIVSSQKMAACRAYGARPPA